jgi:hypothetical protein
MKTLRGYTAPTRFSSILKWEGGFGHPIPLPHCYTSSAEIAEKLKYACQSTELLNITKTTFPEKTCHVFMSKQTYV